MMCRSSTPIPACDGKIDGYVQCICQGEWECEAPGAPACPDAMPPPPCPDPTTIDSGIHCPSPGQQCPGHPQQCGGQTFYDVFECIGYGWEKTVATDCADAGPVVDAGAE